MTGKSATQLLVRQVVSRRVSTRTPPPKVVLPLRTSNASHPRRFNTTAAIIEGETSTLPAALLNPGSTLRASSKPPSFKRPSHSPLYSTERAPQAPLGQSTSTRTSQIRTSPSPSPSPSTATATTASAEVEAASDSIPPSDLLSTVSNTPPRSLPTSVLQNIPRLASQPPFYITIHIHGKPYLVTAGDTLRLPFLMHGVVPGDILRLNRASVLGSRDWTLKGGIGSNATSSTETPPPTLEPRTAAEEAEEASLRHQQSQNLTTTTTTLGYPATDNGKRGKKKGKPTYLDDRLFTCRATVMGVESEPLRVKEKTKQRSRRVKSVKSKHRYTILRIREVSVNGVDELS